MMKYSKTKKFRLNKQMVIVAGLLLAAVVLVFFFLNREDTNSISTDTPTTSPGELAPPTEEEVAQAENHKKQLAEQPSPTAPTESSPAKVSPVITYASQNANKVEVIAFVPGISEEGGICEAKAIQAQNTVSKQVSASRNSSTTDCQQFTFDRSEFTNAGKWSVVVTYKSKTAGGSSEAVEITIN